MRRIAVLTLALCFAAPARADDTADVRAVLDAQLAALARQDASAFAATFLADAGEATRAVFIPPGSDAVFAGASAIAEAVRRWSWDGARATAAAFVGAPAIDVSAGAAIVAADVRLTVQADKPHPRTEKLDARMTALVVSAGKAWKAAAVMLSRPVADRELHSRTFGGYEGGGGQLADLIGDPVALAKAFDPSSSSIAIGTSAKERATGAAGRKVIERWGKLDLRIVGDSDEVEDKTWGYAAASVMWLRKKTDIVVMTALVIARPAPGGKGWRVRSVHFGASR